jgi:hypothetical protein
MKFLQNYRQTVFIQENSNPSILEKQIKKLCNEDSRLCYLVFLYTEEYVLRC